MNVGVFVESTIRFRFDFCFDLDHFIHNGHFSDCCFYRLHLFLSVKKEWWGQSLSGRHQDLWNILPIACWREQSDDFLSASSYQLCLILQLWGTGPFHSQESGSLCYECWYPAPVRSMNATRDNVLCEHQGILRHRHSEFSICYYQCVYQASSAIHRREHLGIAYNLLNGGSPSWVMASFSPFKPLAPKNSKYFSCRLLLVLCRIPIKIWSLRRVRRLTLLHSISGTIREYPF